QHDLPVEVIGFDRRGAAGEALPRRRTRARAGRIAAPLEAGAPACRVLLGADRVDAGRGQHRGTLSPCPFVDEPRVEIGTAERVDRIAEVVEQLAVLPP